MTECLVSENREIVANLNRESGGMARSDSNEMESPEEFGDYTCFGFEVSLSIPLIFVPV